MSNANPLAIDEALNHILPSYHPILQIIAEEYITPNENLLFVADTTMHVIYSYKPVISLSGEYKKAISNTPNLLVVTNKRWITWELFPPEEQLYSIPIDKEYSDNLIFEWCVPTENFFHEYLAANKKKTARDYVTSHVNIMRLSEISLKTQSEFTINNSHLAPKTQLHILRLLVYQNTYCSLKYDDGVHLHKLLQLASLNQGEILIEKEVDDDFQKLKKLKLMFENGLITEIEYQEKKAQLLSNM